MRDKFNNSLIEVGEKRTSGAKVRVKNKIITRFREDVLTRSVNARNATERMNVLANTRE